jgi:hypothetical protein
MFRNQFGTLKQGLHLPVSFLHPGTDFVAMNDVTDPMREILHILFLFKNSKLIISFNCHSCILDA